MKKWLILTLTILLSACDSGSGDSGSDGGSAVSSSQTFELMARSDLKLSEAQVASLGSVAFTASGSLTGFAAPDSFN
ncbi:hypothetical protein [Photobacterium proteolyticum]|nr:hypothetical protein [Photobacterium proteolyticum]